MAANFQDGRHTIYGNIRLCYKIATTCSVTMLLVENAPRGKLFYGNFKMADIFQDGRHTLYMEIFYFTKKSQASVLYISMILLSKVS